MKTAIPTIQGHRGVATVMYIDGKDIAILAKTMEEVEWAYNRLNGEDRRAFDPNKCRKAIIIAAEAIEQ